MTSLICALQSASYRFEIVQHSKLKKSIPFVRGFGNKLVKTFNKRSKTYDLLIDVILNTYVGVLDLNHGSIVDLLFLLR